MLAWDAEGELSSVTRGTDVTSMVYDAAGERLTRKDSTGTTVYLPGGQELLVKAGKVISATRYYTFDGQTIAVRTGKGLGAVTSIVGDPHGTTLAAIPNTNWTATSVTKQYTEPFGATRGGAANVPGERQFLNKTRDTSTGLTMVGARYYDETHGRFISADPILDLTDPQQWNAYAYANSNPTTWSDATGLIINNGPRIDDDNSESGSDEPAGPANEPRIILRQVTNRAYQLMQVWLASPEGMALRANAPSVGVAKSALLTRARTAMTSPNPIGGVIGALGALGNPMLRTPQESALPLDLGLLIVQFHPAGEWDFKNNLRDEFGLKSVREDPDGFYIPTGSGAEVRGDVLGNFQFGYMMSRFGYTEQEAIMASHVGAVAGNDDSVDDPGISAGYALAAQYPDGATEDEFFRYLVSGPTLSELVAAGSARYGS